MTATKRRTRRPLLLPLVVPDAVAADEPTANGFAPLHLAAWAYRFRWARN